MERPEFTIPLLIGVEAYAARKRLPVEEVERWLAPNLGYERESLVS